MDILIIKIIGMAFPKLFVLRNDISTALGFFPLCSGNIKFLHTKGCGNAPFVTDIVIPTIKIRTIQFVLYDQYEL